jgi:hypothetical protein
MRDCEERGSGRWGNEGERQGASKACQRKKGAISHSSTVPWHLGKSKHFPKPE